MIVAAMTSWHQGKLFIEHAAHIGHDSLHVIVGVIVWLGIALVSRRPVTSWTPWLWLFALILWNEAVDLWTEHWPDAGMQYGEGVRDVLLTMLLPTVLMFAATVRPELFRATPKKRRR
jgi:hypothetical protein